jgi:hypothetical protein
MASPTASASTALEYSYHQRNLIPGMTGPQPYRYPGMYIGKQYGQPFGDNSSQTPAIQYVQVINGQIETVYTDEELTFGVRNPRSDIFGSGYGFAELEQLITIITSLLNAEAFNRNFFTNGSHPKGILNFKGDNWSPDQLESFRAQFAAQVSGTNNAWRIPITQSEGLEWTNLQMTNNDMQFNSWLEYLIKISCAVYLIDPAEINFDLAGGVQQTPLFESSQEWKLKASRDRGLKPLLKFIAGLINEHVVNIIDDHFIFEFAGLDELTEQEKHEMLKEQIGSYLTLNEGRRSLDLPQIPGGIGDIPLNPTLVQLYQYVDGKIREEKQQQQEAAQQQQMQAQQQQQGQQASQAAGANEDQSVANQEQNTGQPMSQVPGQTSGQAPTSPPPAYVDLMGKGLTEIRFDDWVDFMREKNG